MRMRSNRYRIKKQRKMRLNGTPEVCGSRRAKGNGRNKKLSKVRKTSKLLREQHGAKVSWHVRLEMAELKQ